MRFKFTKSRNAEFELPFKGYIKKSYQMHNGWYMLILVNNVAVLQNINLNQRIVAGSVKKVIEIDDGKFMLVKKNKMKAVFSPSGKMLADYDQKSNLFCNGWFTRTNGKEIALFDENEQMICSKVTKALVYNDGRYFISVLSGGDAQKVGFFNGDGSRIIFTNDNSFKRLFSYFFIADGSLYDINGECLIDANQGSLFNRNLVRFIGKVTSFVY